MNHELQEILHRIEELEKDSHPPIGLCEFDGFKELVQRLEKIEDALFERGIGKVRTSNEQS